MDSLRLVDSELVALLLLAGIIAAIVAIAHRMQSETVAGVALFLGLHTGMMSDVSLFTLVAACLLAAGAVFFLVANRWVLVPLSTLVAVYSTHAAWMLQHDASGGRALLGVGFLALYFVLFRAAVVARPHGLRPFVQLALPAMNAAGFAALGAAELAGRGRPTVLAFIGAAALAHLALAASFVARRTGHLLSVAYLGLALLLAAIAAWLRLEGVALAAGWAALALAGSLAMRPLGADFLRWIAPAILCAGLALLAPAAGAVAFAVLGAAFIGSERVQEAATPAAGRAARISRALHVAGAAGALMLCAGEIFPRSLAALGWAAAAFALFAAGFALRAPAWRYAGFGVLAATLVRLVAVELPGLGPDERIVSFIALGAALLVVSFVYTRRRAS